MTTEVEITGQQKPLEIEVDWKTAQLLENIHKSVWKIENALGDGWSNNAVSIDSDALAQSIQTALGSAVQELILEMRAAASDVRGVTAPKQSENSPARTEPTSQLNPQVLEQAVQKAITEVGRSVKWNHHVLKTPEPPSEQILDRAGAQGYELINTVYEPASQQWISFLKKLVIG